MTTIQCAKLFYDPALGAVFGLIDGTVVATPMNADNTFSLDELDWCDCERFDDPPLSGEAMRAALGVRAALTERA